MIEFDQGDVSENGQADGAATGRPAPESDPGQPGQLHGGQLQAADADGQGAEAADHPLRRRLPLCRRLGQGSNPLCVRVGQPNSQLFPPGENRLLCPSLSKFYHRLDRSFSFTSGPDWTELI